MAKKGPRIMVRMVSSEGTGHNYFTEKNTRNTDKKLELMKYDPKARKKVKYVEGKKEGKGKKSRERNKSSK